VNDDEVVADASAILALLVGEPFERVEPERITKAWVSAVNLSEVLAKLYEMGLPASDAAAAVARLSLRVLAFDETQAQATAQLKLSTRKAGLSLGDRACLALAKSLGCRAVTADRVWSNTDVGVEVVLIR
jgi:PIN domain nuclease of toxin-antitoxin system